MDFGNELEHFSLRWNDFNDNMKSGLHDLLRTEDFVDVTIAAEGKLIQAHKMVLSVCSPYFKNIFKTNPCQHPVVFLKDVTHKELSGILQFMYLGEVSIQQEELGRFLKTAEALQIKGLTGDDSDKEEVSNTSLHQNHRHPVRNKTKLVNSDSNDKETSSKKMKLSLSSDVSRRNGQTSPVQNQSETVLNNKNCQILPKTEPNESETSDDDSDKILLRDDSVSASESILQLSDNLSDSRNDCNNSPKSSGLPQYVGLPQDVLSGTPGLPNEPFTMENGNQGLKNFPLLTKNQGLCPICGRILQHKRNLQTHISDQHSGIFRSWPCQICHKVCKTWSALRVHTNRHHTKLGSSFLNIGQTLN